MTTVCTRQGPCWSNLFIMILSQQLEEIAARLTNLAETINRVSELEDRIYRLSRNIDDAVSTIEEMHNNLACTKDELRDIQSDCDNIWDDSSRIMDVFNRELTDEQ